MERIVALCAYFPERLSRELCRIGTSYRRFAERLTELRLRTAGVSTLVLEGRQVPLSVRLSREEMDGVVSRMCDGSRYAFRDTIAQGYIPLSGGVRVGVCGRASYEGDTLVGISEIRSLVVRLPHGRCDTVDTLYDAFIKGHGGMLIASPPGIGKTTALRALALRLGTGPHARRVCVVDEREEFDPSAYAHATVDVLCGYRRAVGIEIATRTMSPEVLVIDELSEREAEAVLSMQHTGVPLIASVHAGSLRDVREKRMLKPFFDAEVFSVLARITREGGVYGCEVSAV